jgi:nucleoid-associated protein YgaU
MDEKEREKREKKLGEEIPGQPKKHAHAAPPKPEVIKHVWTKEDTYADLAFKYYGSINEQYWRHIYNHNSHIIGDHPNNIKVGMEIEIPPLPDELKKK